QATLNLPGGSPSAGGIVDTTGPTGTDPRIGNFAQIRRIDYLGFGAASLLVPDGPENGRYVAGFAEFEVIGGNSDGFFDLLFDTSSVDDAFFDDGLSQITGADLVLGGGTINVTAVPEPSSLLALGVIGTGAVWGRRRRRRFTV
ncbi:MAG: PEP-CTERM sorting domain-containing protein, partial [Planctomycetota bacterium]